MKNAIDPVTATGLFRLFWDWRIRRTVRRIILENVRRSGQSPSVDDHNLAINVAIDIYFNLTPIRKDWIPDGDGNG